MRWRVGRISAAVVFAGLLGCQGGGGGAAGLSEADRAAIQKLAVDDAVAALASNNFEAFANTYTEDADYLPPNGPAVKGRAAILEFLKGFPPYTDFKAALVTLQGSGDVGFVHGTYSMMITMPGAAAATHEEGKWVVGVKRQADGTWKSAVGIWNSNLPLPGVVAK